MQKIEELKFMPLIRSFLLFLMLVLISLFARSQNSIEILDIENAVLDEINKYRKTKDLTIFNRSEKLDAVAFDQSEYMSESSRLSHDQDTPKKKTLKDRMLYYEAMNSFAGENIAMFASNSKYTLDNGKAKQVLTNAGLVAKAAIYSWKKDEDSDLNLVDLNFNSVGISVLTNEKQQYIITVILATPPYEFAVSKKAFSFQGIKPYEKEACSELTKKFSNLPQLLSTAFHVENSKLYFTYPSLSLFDEIISSSSDGLSAEIIFNKQFNCGDGNKLFPGDVTNGYLLPYLKKAKLATLNTNLEQKEVMIEMVELPDFFNPSDCEINGIIIKNGHKCETIPYNKIEVKDLRSINIPPQFIGAELNDSTQWLDTIVLEIPLSLSKQEMNLKIAEFELFLRKINFDTKKLEVYKMASPIHQELFAIVDDSSLVTNWMMDSIPIEFISKILWDSLSVKIANSYYEIEYKGLDSTGKIGFIRESIKEDQDLENSLNDLNKIQLHAYGVAHLKSDISKEEKHKLLLNSIATDKTQLAIVLQRSLLEQAADDNESSLNFSLDADQKKTKLPLLNNEIVYTSLMGEKTYDGNPIHIAFLELFLINSNQKEITFNYILSSLNYWSKNNSNMKNVEEMESLFSKLNGSTISKDYIVKLQLYYHLLAANYYYDQSNFDKRRKSFDAILRLYKNANLNELELLDLAKYFTFQDQFSMAVEVLKSDLKNEELSPDYLSYLLQIAFYDSNSFSEEAYFKTVERFSALSQKDFCEFFSKEKRGIQPLGSDDIKEIYCKLCP